MSLKNKQKIITFFSILFLLTVIMLPVSTSFADSPPELPTQHESASDDTKPIMKLPAQNRLSTDGKYEPESVLPLSLNGSGDFTAYCSSPFTIYANFSVNLNITSAKVFYRVESNQTYKNTSMTESMIINGSFSVTNTTMNLSIYRNTENISYFAIGYNVSSNETFYNDTSGEDWNITVIDDITPDAVSGTGDLSAGTGDFFEIFGNFTDNINTSSAEIFFREETEVNYYQMAMKPIDSQLPGVDAFVINILNLSETTGICTINCTTPIRYYIHGYDDANNSGNYSNLGIDWTISLFDNDNPEILGGSQDFSVTTGEPFTIYANFSDNINISHADIYFKRKGSADPFTSVAMNETLGKNGRFFVTKQKLGIDTFNDNTAVWYYVITYDETGNNKQYTKPGTWWKITIKDNDPPTLHSASQNITIGTGDSFNIYANFSDNIELDFIRFYYKNMAWDHWEFNEFSVVDANMDKVWEYNISSLDLDVEIDTSNDDSDYLYYIRAFDKGTPKSNRYNYTVMPQGFRIHVIDDDPPVLVKAVADQGSKNFKATTGEGFIIYANFTDNIEIDYAALYIRKETQSNGWSQSINMTESETTPGRFSISNIDLKINTTGDDTDYEYYIECYDTSGNILLFNSAGEPFYITVKDNDDPIAIAGQDVTIEAETTVDFNGNESYDNIGIISFEWSFIYDKLEQKFDTDKASFRFLTPGNYKIVLSVYDAANNLGTDELWVNVSDKNYPPEIDSFFPEEDKKVYVFQDIKIWVKFNENMDIDKNSINFFFVNDSSGNSVDGNFDWFVDRVSEIYQLSFTPNGSLKYAETYTITITRNVRETHPSGLRLKSGKVWSFSTYPEDSDNDGLLDEWEVDNFGNINQVGPSDDPDDDGFTNLEEHNANTDPNNKKSHPPESKPPVEEKLNMALIGIGVAFVILILIILLVAVMAWKKKKAEEEEAKKPKPIEHEILFEDGKTGLTGTGEVPETGAPAQEPGIGPEGMEGEDEGGWKTEPAQAPKQQISEPKKLTSEVRLEPELEHEEPAPEMGPGDEPDLDLDLETTDAPQPPDSVEPETELPPEDELEPDLGMDEPIEGEVKKEPEGAVAAEDDTKTETESESEGDTETASDN